MDINEKIIPNFGKSRCGSLGQEEISGILTRGSTGFPACADFRGGRDARLPSV
jgi:hypothetical protein